MWLEASPGAAKSFEEILEGVYFYCSKFVLFLAIKILI
jgi:hypothetical protein